MAMSRLDGCWWFTTLPPMRISPDEICSRPAIVLRRVDLPQPDGPTSTRKPPFSSVMSIPFRTSIVPKRLRRALISSVAMSSSLYGAGHQAADKISPGNGVDEQCRRRSNDRGRHVDVVFDDAGRGVDEVVERNRHRRGIASSEGRAEKKIVPDVGELVDHGDDDDRHRVRQQDATEDLEEARAVDHRRLDELVREGLVIVAEEQGGEAKAVDHMDDHQIDRRVAEAERPASYIG